MWKVKLLLVYKIGHQRNYTEFSIVHVSVYFLLPAAAAAVCVCIIFCIVRNGTKNNGMRWIQQCEHVQWCTTVKNWRDTFSKWVNIMMCHFTLIPQSRLRSRSRTMHIRSVCTSLCMLNHYGAHLFWKTEAYKEVSVAHNTHRTSHIMPSHRIRPNSCLLRIRLTNSILNMKP